MNLTEQLKDNFEIILTDPKADFRRIWGDEHFTYERAVKSIISKLKELGYKKLPLAFRPLPYILVEDCKYTAVVAVVKDFTESEIWKNAKTIRYPSGEEYEEAMTSRPERKYEDDEPRWVNGKKKPIL